MSTSSMWFGRVRSSMIVVATFACAGSANAQRTMIVSVGNQLPTGGWCDASLTSVAAGGTRQVMISGKIDGAGYTQIAGKYRMKTQTDKFEWAAGAEPSVTFYESSSTPGSFGIKAKSTTAAGTYAISFAAVDAAQAESAQKSCNITVTAPAGVKDLKTTIPGFKKEGDASYVTSGDMTSGTRVTLRIVVANTQNTVSPEIRINVNRFDHTCTGMAVAVGSFQATVDPLKADTVELTDANPPVLATTTAATYCYKAAMQTASGGYYTDGTNANNTAQRTIRFIPSTTPVANVKFGDYLYAKFLNAKCLDCHSFTDNSTTRRTAHNNAGRMTTTTDVTANATCSGCHNSSATCTGSPGCVNGWRGAVSAMNWRNLTAAQACALIKQGTFATASHMSTHLKTDALIVWAIGRQNIPTSEWNAKVDAWINDGMRCS